MGVTMRPCIHPASYEASLITIMLASPAVLLLPLSSIYHSPITISAAYRLLTFFEPWKIFWLPSARNSDTSYMQQLMPLPQ